MFRRRACAPLALVAAVAAAVTILTLILMGIREGSNPRVAFGPPLSISSLFLLVDLPQRTKLVLLNGVLRAVLTILKTGMMRVEA